MFFCSFLAYYFKKMTKTFKEKYSRQDTDITSQIITLSLGGMVSGSNYHCFYRHAKLSKSNTFFQVKSRQIAEKSPFHLTEHPD